MTGMIERADKINGSNIVTVPSTGVVLLNKNLARRGMLLQNIGTVPVYVYFGAGASLTQVSVILAPDTSAGNGSGGVFSTGILIVTDQITATVSSTSGSVIATEI